MKCIGEIEVIQFLLRFHVYSSLVVEPQENVNLQVAYNLSHSLIRCCVHCCGLQMSHVSFDFLQLSLSDRNV